jgi:hypothetical protein
VLDSSDLVRYLIGLLLVCVFSVSDAQNLQNGLLACYSFTGNAQDGTSNANHGTVFNAKLVPDRFGSANSAYEFTGSKYIAIPAAPFLNRNYSYSCWAKMYTIPTMGESNTVISIGDNNTGYHQTINFNNNYGTFGFVGINGGGFNSGGPENVTGVQTNALADAFAWYHIVSMRSDTEMKLYVNGVLIGTSSTNNSLPKYGSPNAALIGMRSNMTLPFDGAIDDIAIYNRTLTEAEVLKLFNDGLACDETLVAGQPFFIPNIITPDNGDTLNQIFTLYFIRNKEYVAYDGDAPFTMDIYNRWEKKVFTTTNGAEGWTGQSLTTGVYYFTIRVGTNEFKGWVHLVK